MKMDSKDTGFKSYILDDSSFESISLHDVQRTKFLDGEHLVTEAQRVLLYAPISDRKIATLGILTITNFKLSFVSVKEKDEVDECYQRSLLLGPYEVCLSSIDAIYQIGDRSRKKLLADQQVSSKVKELAVICKNMRMFEFSFKFADKDKGKNIANALVHYSYPKKHGFLFAYAYKEPYYKTDRNIKFFRSTEDWKRELLRTGCKNWRISLVNQHFQMSTMLPQVLVVPLSVTDANLSHAVEHFRNRCCPIWVWGTSSGAALVRMSDLLPTITNRTQENIMLEHVRKSHTEKRPPYIMDLSKDCPSPKDIQISYLKLRDLCTPDSIRTFKMQDFKFYGLLDNTKWLQHVSTTLRKAMEGASVLSQTNPTSVVLQEGNGQDMNCVISSLIQLILDPCWRTVNGFQSLVQKEWVALAHPFCLRLGLVANDEQESSPLFLLFLDCVWQLLQQFPTAFQFTDTYLTTLWDSVYINIFDTFLFNSEHERFLTQKGTGCLILRSVWDWKEQFMEKHIALFCNPLFDDNYLYRLHPKPEMACLDIWTQCYSRWLPDLEIQNGGKPQIDLCSRIITSEIHILRQKLLRGDVNGTVKGLTGDGLHLLKKVNSFFPFTRDYGQIPGNVSLDNSLLSGDTLDTQSILNHSSAND